MNKCVNLNGFPLFCALSWASQRRILISPISAEVFQLVRESNAYTYFSARNKNFVVIIIIRAKRHLQTHVENYMSQGEGTSKNGRATIRLWHQAETCRHWRMWCKCRGQTECPTFPKQTHAGVAEGREEEILWFYPLQIPSTHVTTKICSILQCLL